ncbi:tripartite tricarboxylate transporter TctB family protein [Nitratireductor sp. B36]|uniref:tripartite tricarboxylate transporter TctB family protein n=1 Tax=Nitratireductor sp. B36 TaxID=2762059 RepID=UPI001E4425A6|nr:tripartite tricarboxylate transporter TctB family protein [Nitratireductor sp. B36]MCC5777519.1 tripartite tricarboxylate transporter TctB family protein [Nitratireductor sp. B36]
MRMNDAVTGGVFVLLSALILFAARGFPTLPDQPYGPGTFPTIIAAVMMVCGLALIWSGARSRVPLLAVADWMRGAATLHRMAWVPGFVIAYVYLSKPIGFPLLVPVLLGAFLTVTTGRPVRAAAIAVLGTAALWLLFAYILRVPLPLGLLTEVIY